MSLDGSIALLVARFLVSGVFLFSANAKLRNDPREIQAIVGLHLPFPNLLSKLAAICEIVGVLMLTLGIATRLAATLLGIFLIVVTLACLQFWKIPDDDQRFGAENAFFGNFGLLGGLIYIAMIGPGALAVMPA